jgi:hypothetical protein
MIPSGTPVAWPFRLWLAVEVLFGLAAISSIGRFPAETDTQFAWPIDPVVMAATLGGFYIAAAGLFLAVVLARRWEMIRVMVPAAIVFTSAELLATFLHWDKFSVDTFPFYVWFASYLLPPPIFLAMYVWHQRRSPGMAQDRPLPRPLRRLMFGLGLVLTVEATIGFAFTSWFTGSFPWALTPLTARALCGWLLGVGVLLLSIARENDRDRVRLASPLLLLLLPAVGFEVLRYSDQVDGSSPRLWIGFSLFGVLGLCGLYLARGSWRQSLR